MCLIGLKGDSDAFVAARGPQGLPGLPGLPGFKGIPNLRDYTYFW